MAPPCRLPRTYILLMAVLGLAVSSSEAWASSGIFLVDGKRPARIVISTSARLGPLATIDADMPRAVEGILRTYDRKAVPRLLRCATKRASRADHLPLRAEFYVHLFGKRGLDHDVSAHEADRIIAVALSLDDKGYLAWDRDQTTSVDEAVVLHGVRMARELASGPLFQGEVDLDGLESMLGVSEALNPPYIAADITMDHRTMSERMHGGVNIRDRPPTKRQLSDESFIVRLPMDYDPRRPAGLLVWCNPLPEGRIPLLFEPALDELGVICVTAANAGNKRPIPDRFQLMFDLRANAMRRYHIDPDRVYITGMSGGGKVTSAMTVCFPEYFSGAVSIVGFNAYAKFNDVLSVIARPPRRVLALARERPFALISGPPDFNYTEMRHRFEALQADGFGRMRFFDIPDLAHAMPTSDQFAEALSWVEGFARTAREQRETHASDALERYTRDRDDNSPVNTSDRARLVAIVNKFPWTDAAWSALQLLEPTVEVPEDW